ncbi:MAG TPA: alpha/beta hydrolase [Verrucomicrobiae bacterium]|nr:alpha/beta hydrolase [Verrucomicrobiae bacterium]
MSETLQMRVHGDRSLPVLVYLPGLHGDWTLKVPFRRALAGRACLVEFMYPRTFEWSLADYAGAVQKALADAGIHAGWILAESFGSQIAWAILGTKQDFTPLGIFLLGGFARYPWLWAVRMVRWFASHLPRFLVQAAFRAYASAMRFRHRGDSEALASIDDFLARRTREDAAAMWRRLDLILAADFAPAARHATIPVWYLSGLWDFVVPWPLVRGWLRRDCAALRADRVVRKADHNVLATAPETSAEQIMKWLEAELAVGNLRAGQQNAAERNDRPNGKPEENKSRTRKASSPRLLAGRAPNRPSQLSATTHFRAPTAIQLKLWPF